LGQDVSIGPEKAAILEEVKANGSIAAAGRSMVMAYKRAWYIDLCFRFIKGSFTDSRKG
jgi:molybdate transport system regulatory protein